MDVQFSLKCNIRRNEYKNKVIYFVSRTWVCFFFSSRRRHTRSGRVTGVQTCVFRSQMPQIGYMRMTSKIRHQSHPSPGFGRAKPMETTDMSMVAGSCSRYLYSLYYTLHYFFCCFQPLHYHYNYVFSSFVVLFLFQVSFFFRLQ